MKMRHPVTLCVAFALALCSQASADGGRAGERVSARDAKEPSPPPAPKPEEKPIVLKKQPSEPARTTWLASSEAVADHPKMGTLRWLRSLVN